MRCPAPGPGPAGESLEHYVKRLRDLEQIATRHSGRREGLRDAGRTGDPGDGRPGEIDDDDADAAVHEIAREIEKELEYPGQIKVTVIRESRAIEYAR